MPDSKQGNIGARGGGVNSLHYHSDCFYDDVFILLET